MLELLTNPVVWLLFLTVGLVEGRLVPPWRGIPALAASLYILFAFCGPKTGFIYIGLGTLIALLSYVPWCQVPLVVASSLLVIAYTALRNDMMLVAPFLPSLSYFGFRAVALAVEVQKIPLMSLQQRMLQMLFFPIVVMGPITRPEHFAWHVPDAAQAMRRLISGLVFLLIGYGVAPWVLSVYDLQVAPSLFLWRSAVTNSIKLYCDFAGYTDLVIGLGCLCGFTLPENFDNPYMSPNISVFWRRWHMSLSFWIRDFLYIPLGGSRRGFAYKIVLLIVSMSICGVWHGLAWNFLAWGFYHGMLLVVHSICKRLFLGKFFFQGSVWNILSIVMTFLSVTLGWILFSYPLPQAWNSILRMFA